MSSPKDCESGSWTSKTQHRDAEYMRENTKQIRSTHNPDAGRRKDWKMQIKNDRFNKTFKQELEFEGLVQEEETAEETEEDVEY